MYSQNNEEEVITRLIGQRPSGSFLDIGAYDGKTFSNTLRLVELGWSGVCVEPSPNSFDALLRLHGDKPQLTLVNCAVASTAGLVRFFDSGGDAVSSMSAEHKTRWEAGSKVRFKTFWLQTIALHDLFSKFGYDFDFINLDVESANWELFQLMPWAALRNLRVICVEHDGKHEQMLEIARFYGFRQELFNGENIIMAR